jgi:hypothetical protein
LIVENFLGAEEDRGLELESAQEILDTMIGYCEAQLHSASALNTDQLAALAQAQRGYAQLQTDLLDLSKSESTVRLVLKEIAPRARRVLQGLAPW